MPTVAVLDLFKAAATPSMRGRLVLSRTGWLMLEVPNAVGRGLFDALDEPGIETPISETTGRYQAHISVMRPEELDSIGGPMKVTERGRDFSYLLGKVESFAPAGWPEMSKCWVVNVKSPELEKLRKTYGLSAIPNDGKYQFHITFAVRRKNVLGSNEVSKSDGKPLNRVGSFMLDDRPGVHLLKASSVLDLFKGVRHGNDTLRDEGGSCQARLPVSDEGQAVSNDTVPDAGAGKSAACDHGSDQDGSCAPAGADSGAGRGRAKGAADAGEGSGSPTGCDAHAATDLRVVPDSAAGPVDYFSSCVLGHVKHGEVTVAQAIARAARHAVDPVSAAQAEAGNYRKGHVNMHGLQITIETPKGAVRSGTDKEGKKWSIEMANHYGYIRKSEDLDGDHVDVFLGPHPEAELVYVVDQIDPATKKFDEHKCLLGFLTLSSAKDAYKANYQKTWKGLGKITPVTMQQFKEWLKDGSQKRPISTQTFKMKKAGADASSENPAILFLQGRTAVRFITPDQPRGQHGRFEERDIPKAFEDAFAVKLGASELPRTRSERLHA